MVTQYRDDDYDQYQGKCVRDTASALRSPKLRLVRQSRFTSLVESHRPSLERIRVTK